MRRKVSNRGQVASPVKVQSEQGLRPGKDPVDEVYGMLRGQGLPSSDELIEELQGPAPWSKPKRRAHRA